MIDYFQCNHTKAPTYFEERVNRKFESSMDLEKKIRFTLQAADSLDDEEEDFDLVRQENFKGNPSQVSSAVKVEAFSYMDQLLGWCSKLKASFLIDLVLRTKPEVVVEIGVFGGMSLVPMACAARANGFGIVYGIDPWSSDASLEQMKADAHKEYWSQVDHEEILSGLKHKIVDFDLKNIELLRCTSEAAPEISNIGVLHVDGNHSEKTSFFDVQKWVPLVKSGGYIVFDDMNWKEEGHNTTGLAVQWLDENCVRIADFTDDAQWGLWVKP